MEAPARVVLQQVWYFALIYADLSVKAGGIRLAKGGEQGKGGLLGAKQRGFYRILSIDGDMLGHELKLVRPLAVFLCTFAQLLGFERAAVPDVHAGDDLPREAVKVIIKFGVCVIERDFDRQAEISEAVGQLIRGKNRRCQQDKHQQRTQPASTPPAASAPAAGYGLVHVFDFSE